MSCSNCMPKENIKCECRPVTLRDKVIIVGKTPPSIIKQLEAENKEVIVFKTIDELFISILGSIIIK